MLSIIDLMQLTGLHLEVDLLWSWKMCYLQNEIEQMQYYYQRKLLQDVVEILLY